MDFNNYKDNSMETLERFREDAMKELNLLDHNKADWMWSLAWKHGSMYGFEEVFFHLRDLTEMFAKDSRETNEKLN